MPKRKVAIGSHCRQDKCVNHRNTCAHSGAIQPRIGAIAGASAAASWRIAATHREEGHGARPQLGCEGGLALLDLEVAADLRRGGIGLVGRGFGAASVETFLARGGPPPSRRRRH